jgi:hypothetical protein
MLVPLLHLGWSDASTWLFAGKVSGSSQAR